MIIIIYSIFNTKININHQILLKYKKIGYEKGKF